MNVKRIVAVGGAVVLASAIAGGVYAATTAFPPRATDTPQVGTVATTTLPSPSTTPTSTPTLAPTPTPTPSAASVVETPTPSAPQDQVKHAAPPAAPAHPAAPVRCPAGSMANSNDGTNDTSCLPTICFSILVPDPAHPECDTPFKP